MARSTSLFVNGTSPTAERSGMVEYLSAMTSTTKLKRNTVFNH